MDTNKGQIILYQTADGKSKIEVTLANDTVWLTIDQMAELFQRNKSTISRHIKNVFDEGELNREVVVAFFATTKMKVEGMLLLFCLIGTVRQLQNIFVEGELDKESVCRKFRRTATDGKNYSIQYYSLDAIIAVGYRVKMPALQTHALPLRGLPLT